MGSLRIIGKGAAYALTGMFISKILTYIWRLVIARMGPEDYGFISLALTILGISYSLSSLGLGTAVTRYVAYFHGLEDLQKMKGVISTALKLAVPLSLIISAIVFTYSDAISNIIFRAPGLSTVLKIISFGIVPYIIYILAIAALTGLKKIEYVIFSRQIVESITRLLVTLGLLYIGYGVLGVGIAYVSAYLFGALSAVYFLEKSFPFINTKIKAASLDRELLTYSLPLLFSEVIVQALSWTDTLMIGYFKNAAHVGIYNTAAPTAGLILMIPSALSVLFLPVITTAYAKGLMGNIKTTYRKITKLIIAANLPMLLLMVFFSEDILTFLFGYEYSSGSGALIFLSVGYFISAVTGTSGSILDMFKKTKILMAISIASTLINVGMNYLLIPRYGINGAAFASAISLVVGSVLLSAFSFKSINMLPFDKSILYLSLFGTISMGGVYFCLHALYGSIPIIPAVIGVLVFFLIYSYLILKFEIVEMHEIKQVIEILKKSAVPNKRI